MQTWDVIVVGSGHAGLEAAAAAARLGCRTALVTLSENNLGALSCNPAIGGVGKGQLVKEIDALGGLMGRLADQACIHYRRLNATRGAAVHSTRMQVDRAVYQAATRDLVAQIPNLVVIPDEALGLETRQGAVQGVRLRDHGIMAAAAVVLTPGTFFHGLIHVGHEQVPGGRWHEPGVAALPEWLQAQGFVLGRFKTGTTPRLDRRTIDYSRFQEQPGDAVFTPFSFGAPVTPRLPQVSCFIGQTNPETHRLIRDHLHLSALYSGIITGTGVRYCPSVEDKIVKFASREHHHVFIEPEGLQTDWVYPNGLSNSLPLAIQLHMVRSVAGLEKAEIVQAGYGIEHDYLDPTQLKPSLEAKTIAGLFFAGQINGTTGYEEAAAQGLMAGMNAARQVAGQEPVVLRRDQAYIGVLIDDLVTKGTQEPYRMFTSRVEYRLVIREDNADERLTPLGHALGLVDDETYQQFCQRVEALAREEDRLQRTRTHAPVAGQEPRPDGATLAEWLGRPEVTYADLAQVDAASGTVPAGVQAAVSIRTKYAGYIRRQAEEIERFLQAEQIRIPDQFVYAGLPGLSLEVIEKLTRLKPQTLGQASRISGITPAAISLLMLHVKRRHPAS